MKQATTKKAKAGKIAIAVAVAAVAAYGTIAALHGEPDPNQWSGQRSDYKNTK